VLKKKKSSTEAGVGPIPMYTLHVHSSTCRGLKTHLKLLMSRCWI